MKEQGRFIVSIRTPDRVAFDRLTSKYHVDLFHNATFDEQKKQFSIGGIISLEQIGQLVYDGYRVEVKAYHPDQGIPSSQIADISKWLKEQTEKDKVDTTTKSVYEGGEILPRQKYLDYDGFWQGFNLFHNVAEEITKLGAVGGTHERRGIACLTIARQAGENRRGVLLLGGLHARELINPDALLSLAYDLIYAFKKGTGIKYGDKVFSSDVIKRIFDRLKIYVVPLGNPDGREHAMNFYNMWRMNRNPNGGRTCPQPNELDGKGVDVNRNFDFLWESGIKTTSDPCYWDQTYKGEKAFSEPESNWLPFFLDRNPHIDSMVDVHSHSELVLYPWQIDENQDTDPTMNFQNPAYDGQRGHTLDMYKEYIPQNDLQYYRVVTAKVAESINSVRGGDYRAQQGPYYPVYPASASSMDYAYSRNFVDSKKTKIFAIAFETAKAFNPIDPEDPDVDPDDKWQITKEISAGLVEFLFQRASL